MASKNIAHLFHVLNENIGTDVENYLVCRKFEKSLFL